MTNSVITFDVRVPLDVPASKITNQIVAELTQDVYATIAESFLRKLISVKAEQDEDSSHTIHVQIRFNADALGDIAALFAHDDV